MAKIGFSQGADTIVTNLNIKASTVYSVAARAKLLENPAHFVAYVKLFNTIRSTTPADNANVNIDTIPTLLISEFYKFLIETPYLRTQFEDFQTSVQSKRNTNNYLDGLLDAIDLFFTQSAAAIISSGKRLITGN